MLSRYLSPVMTELGKKENKKTDGKTRNPSSGYTHTTPLSDGGQEKEEKERKEKGAETQIVYRDQLLAFVLFFVSISNHKQSREADERWNNGDKRQNPGGLYQKVWV
jgi:hypothetical protein